jgi:hypothetical protein
MLTVSGDDAIGHHLAVPIGHHLDIALRQRGIPGVGQHDALTTDLVGGHDLGTQRGVSDRLGDLALRYRYHQFPQRRVLGHRKGEDLLLPVQRSPRKPL